MIKFHNKGSYLLIDLTSVYLNVIVIFVLQTTLFLLRVHCGGDRMAVGFTKFCLCHQCLSPLMLWVRIPLMARCTWCDKVCQWLAAGQWFSPSTLISPTYTIDHHDIAEILLKVTLNTIHCNTNSNHLFHFCST